MPTCSEVVERSYEVAGKEVESRLRQETNNFRGCWKMLGRITVIVLALFISSCSRDSTGVEQTVDLTGFWSGRTTYDISASCDLLGCYYDSRMMIVQSGKTVTGWYRARANQVSDQTPITGTIQGDTLSLLVNSGQISWVGAMKFGISRDGRSIVARQDKKTISLSIE